MSNRDIKLPEGSYRNQEKGYEEIHIPFSQAPPFSNGEALVQTKTMPDWAQLPFEGIKYLNRVQSRLYEYAMFSPVFLLVNIG